MTNFYDSLKDLVSPDLVKKAAATLEEKPENVSKAISAIIPGLLAMYLKKHSPQINNILTEAGNLDILSNVEKMTEENPTKDQRRISDTFLQDMLGDKAADFINPIAQQAGISKVAGNRLVSMIAPFVAGYMGQKLVKDKWSITKLLTEVSSFKDKYKKELPDELLKSLDLNYVMNSPTAEERKKSTGWLWAIVIILLLLLLLWGWRSCDNKEVEEVKTVVTEDVKKVIDPAMDEINHLMEEIEVSLPNGHFIKVYKNSAEDKMVKFLRSDEYKKASSDDLKKKWFEFESIDFEYGSTTELTANGSIQLDNIAAILKAFPNAKVGIIAFTDKKGTEKVNMEISKERAVTIEKMLEERGVGKQIVKTDGYGEEYATHSVKETDVQRAPDRDIALRFVK